MVNQWATYPWSVLFMTARPSPVQPNPALHSLPYFLNKSSDATTPCSHIVITLKATSEPLPADSKVEGDWQVWNFIKTKLQVTCKLLAEVKVGYVLCWNDISLFVFYS